VSSDPPTLRPRALAALDALLRCYTSNLPLISAPAVAGLLPLLWSAAFSPSPSARAAAARWSAALVSEFDPLAAAHLLCHLAGDADSTTAAEAREGLGVSEGGAVRRIVDDGGGAGKGLPGLGEFVGALWPGEEGRSGRPPYERGNAATKLAVLEVSLALFLSGPEKAEKGPLLKLVGGVAATLTAGAARTPPALSDAAAAALLVLLGRSGEVTAFFEGGGGPLAFPQVSGTRTPPLSFAGTHTHPTPYTSCARWRSTVRARPPARTWPRRARTSCGRRRERCWGGRGRCSRGARRT
jgi:hypothetical protein